MNERTGRLALLLIFSAGFFGYIMRTTDWLSAIPGDMVDARFNSVILEHLYLWVLGKTPSLWSPTFFFPFEGVLAFSDNHFGSGGAYVLFRLAGLPREAAYQAWFIAGTVLNFWVGYYVLRRLGFSMVAAGCGAFVFAFGLPALAKEAHAQLTWRFAVPLAYLSFYRALDERSVRQLALAAAWCAVQFLCSIYLGIFTAYLLFAMAVAFAFSDGRSLPAGWARELNASSAASRLVVLALFLGSGAAVLWLLLNYQSIASHYGLTRSHNEILTMLPTPGSYLIADGSALSGWVGSQMPKYPMRHELQLFVGLGPWVLALVGLGSIIRQGAGARVGRTALIALLVIVALTLLIGNVTAYRALLHLPGLSSVRAVSRIVLVMLLPFGILVAVGVDRMAPWIARGRWRWIVLLLVIGSVTAESLSYRPYATPAQNWRDRQVGLRSLMPADGFPPDTILFVTGQRGSGTLHDVEVDGIILAQDLGLATLNGYSGNIPPNYFKPDPCLDFRNRLDGYFAFKPSPALSRDALASRVRVISPEACPVTPGIVSQRAVDAQLATHVSLSVRSGGIQNGRLHLQVSMTNKSGQEFTTWSTRGPIRLSWRYVPLGADGKDLAAPDFEGRRELNFFLPDGQTIVQPLDLALPPPGRYRVEVTLVQDGVAWFHDLGMVVAGVDVDVR